MKKTILKTAVIISGVLFFTACSKDDSIKNILKEETAGQAAQKGKPISQLTRIKTRTLGLNITTFTYDASGRATGYTGSSFLTYDYPDASHVIETPQWSPVTNYDLNNKGLAVKATDGNSSNIFTYNAKKQVESDFYESNGVTGNITYIYVNGNLDKMTIESSNTSAITTASFTYYLDKPNVLDNDVFGESFRGAGSKNLVKSRTAESNGVTGTTDYSYDFDLQGRVVKVRTAVNGTPQADVSYSYY